MGTFVLLTLSIASKIALVILPLTSLQADKNALFPYLAGRDCCSSREPEHTLVESIHLEPCPSVVLRPFFLEPSIS